MKNLIRLTTISTLLLVCTSLLAQKSGYQIDVKIKNLQDTSIFLAYHYGDKQYIKDTLLLGNDGTGSFKGAEPLPQGIYLVVMPSKSYFEIVVGEDQHFSIQNDTANYTTNFKSEGSLENKVFYSDIQFLGKKGMERATLQQQYEGATNETKKAALKEELIALDKEVKDHRKQIVKEHPDLLYSKILLLLQDIEIPESPKDETGNEIDSLFGYKYMKQHYFDNVDFADDRLLRTPILLQKVNVFLDKWTSPEPDSVNAVVDYILTRALPNDESFKFWAITLLNKYANSKIMGQDAIYVHIVEKYYATGKAYWVETADSMRIVDNALSTKPLLIGKKAPRLTMKDLNGKYQNIEQIDSKYLLLYFYSDDCGHCKKETPKLVAAYDTLKTKYSLKIFAADTEIERENWVNFVKKYNMQDFINVADVELQNLFRTHYNIKSTPQVYLLDEDRKIIAKKLAIEQLPDVLESLEKRDANGKDRVLDDNVTIPK